MPTTPAACGGRAGDFAPRTPRARTRALRRCAPPVLPYSAKRGRPARHSAPRSGWCSAARRIRYADRRANTSAGGQSRPCGTLLTSWCSRGASRGPWGPTAPTPCRLAARLRLASHKKGVRPFARVAASGAAALPGRPLALYAHSGPAGPSARAARRRGLGLPPAVAQGRPGAAGLRPVGWRPWAALRQSSPWPCARSGFRWSPSLCSGPRRAPFVARYARPLAACGLPLVALRCSASAPSGPPWPRFSPRRLPAPGGGAPGFGPALWAALPPPGA